MTDEQSWREVTNRAERVADPSRIVKWATSEKNPLVERAAVPKPARGTIPTRDLRLPPVPKFKPVKPVKPGMTKEQATAIGEGLTVLFVLVFSLVLGVILVGWLGIPAGFIAALWLLAQRRPVRVRAHRRRRPRR